MAPSAQTLRTNNNLAFSFYLCYTFILHICRPDNSFDKMRLHILSLFDIPEHTYHPHNASLLSGSSLFLLPFAYSPHRFPTCIFKAKKINRSVHPQFTQFPDLQQSSNLQTNLYYLCEYQRKKPAHS